MSLTPTDYTAVESWVQIHALTEGARKPQLLMAITAAVSEESHITTCKTQGSWYTFQLLPLLLLLLTLNVW